MFDAPPPPPHCGNLDHATIERSEETIITNDTISRQVHLDLRTLFSPPKKQHNIPRNENPGL